MSTIGLNALGGRRLFKENLESKLGVNLSYTWI